VELCTAVKLNEAVERSKSDSLQRADFLFSLIEFVRNLWRWELKRLTGMVGDVADHTLMSRLAHSQPLAAKARAWAHVCRVCGLAESCYRGFLWARYATSTTPRHLVYASAAELFFQIPELLAGTKSRDFMQTTASHDVLPLGTPGTTWPERVYAISQNYHTVLEFTRT
jgi:hypothetical protein